MKFVPRSLEHLQRHVPALAVLIAFLALAFSAFFGHRNYTETRARASFAQSETVMMDQVQAQLDVYLTVMKGVRAVFSASEFINPRELASYFQTLKVNDLERNSGLEDIGVIWAVPPQDREKHLALMRKYYPGYTLSGLQNGPVHYPLVHLESLGQNAAEALGWNAAAEPLREEALRRARETGEPAVTAKTRLFMANGGLGASGFIIYLPIFAKESSPAPGQPQTNVVGFVFTSYDASTLWSKLFRYHQGISDIEIYDGNSSDPANLLFDKDGISHAELGYKPLLQSEVRANVFGRPWNFLFYTHSDFEGSFERRLPVTLLALGVLGSFLVFALLVVQTNARTRAEELSDKLAATEKSVREANAALAEKVAELRQTGSELAKSLSIQIATLESTADGILVLDLAGKIINFNQPFLSMWRIPPEIIAHGENRHLIRYVREQLADPDAFVRRAEELYSNPNATTQDTLLLKDGRVYIRFSIPQRNAGETIGRVLSFRDVTQQRRAEERLKESERLYQSLVQTLPQSIFRKNLEGRYTFANDSFCKLLKVTPGQVVGMTDLELFPDTFARKYRADDQRVIDSGTSYHAVDSISTVPGAIRYIQMVRTPLLDNQGRVVGLQGIFWDITEEKAADDKLAAEKERLAVTLRAIGDAVVAANNEGRIHLMNPLAEQMCGMAQTEAAGKIVEEVFPLSDRETRAPLQPVLEQVIRGEPVNDLKPALLSIPQGREFIVRRRAAPTRDAAGKISGAVFVFRDVTQEQKLEDELLRASKLESVGLLAGGIAHDFNNVLTGIVGNLSLLREYPGLPAEVVERLGLLEKSGLKARQLTQQLVTFAKGGLPVKRSAAVAELVRESAEFALRGSNVQLECRFEPDIATVEIDPGQINQVIQNLAINSKESMPDGGTLTLSLANVEVPANSDIGLRQGLFVRISVSDTGCGISSENLPRVFDPFFTTKPKGSGLGLPAAYSIIKRHEGLITVESGLGKGTTFHIYIPASIRRSPVVELPQAAPPPANRSARILAMDDEPAIRALLTAILQHFGYQSTVVADGAEALREYKNAMETGEPYAAVIMDLTIPGGMGGKEAIRHLKERDPHVKAIVCSGYSTDAALSDFKSHGFIARVEKPYRLQEMGSVLRAISPM